MRNAVVGGMLGAFLGAGILVFMMVACGGSGTSAGTQLVIGESILAAAHIDGDPTTPVVNRFVNHLGSSVTVTRFGVGAYNVDFGFDVSGRFFSLTSGRGSFGVIQTDRVVSLLPSGSDPNTVDVFIRTASTSMPTDLGWFYITVY